MRQWIVRLLYGLLFAIPLMLLSSVLVKASPDQAVAQADPLDCASCHQSFQKVWESGAHGQATKDPAFMDAWKAQGQPAECMNCHVTGYDAEAGTWEADGVTCQVCHSQATVGHPLSPMTVNQTAELCGKCHTETYVEWQVSTHGEKGIDCSGCHDPHATSLKTKEVQELCASCHSARVENFTHTQHIEQGLNCGSCHLEMKDTALGKGTSKMDHTFNVGLAICNDCHKFEMHHGVQPHSPSPSPTPDAMMSVEQALVTEQPQRVSQMGFTTIAGLVGLALGIIIAPWIGKFQRRAKINEDK